MGIKIFEQSSVGVPELETGRFGLDSRLNSLSAWLSACAFLN